jgi:hypothetical protein
MFRHLSNISDHRVHFVTEGEAVIDVQNVVDRLVDKMNGFEGEEIIL